jgi:hypothetical protein
MNAIEKVCSNDDAARATEDIAPVPAQQLQPEQQAAAQQGAPQPAAQQPQPGQQTAVQPGAQQQQAPQQQQPQPGAVTSADWSELLKALPMRAVTPEDWWELLKASSSDTLDQHPMRRAVTWLLFRMYAGATAFAPQVDLDMWRCAAVAAAVQKLCCGPALAVQAAIKTLASDRVHEVAAALQKLGRRPAPAVEAAVAALVPNRVREHAFKVSVSKARQKAARGKLPKGITLGFLASREDIAAALKKLLEKLPLLQVSNR